MRLKLSHVVHAPVLPLTPWRATRKEAWRTNCDRVIIKNRRTRMLADTLPHVLIKCHRSLVIRIAMPYSRPIG
jgi:hypothetical protein